MRQPVFSPQQIVCACRAAGRLRSCGYGTLHCPGFCAHAQLHCSSNKCAVARASHPAVKPCCIFGLGHSIRHCPACAPTLLLLCCDISCAFSRHTLYCDSGAASQFAFARLLCPPCAGASLLLTCSQCLVGTVWPERSLASCICSAVAPPCAGMLLLLHPTCAPSVKHAATCL